MDIPEEVQDKLKCSECNDFLSCGPIYVLHRTGGTICGRCSSQPEDLIEFSERTRIISYEATASLLSFPCAFASHGCPEKLPFSMGVPPHESNCKFRPFFCPISCDWTGPWPKLKQHFDKKHKSLIFENPCNPPQPDLTTSNSKSYLISAFNFIFLLQLKVCLTSEKMFHSVRMFGDAAFVDKFSFKLDVEGNNMNFAKSGLVLRPGFQSIDEPTAVFTTLNCLSGLFNANDSKFTMRIQPLFKWCVNCFREIENDSDAKFCDSCKEKLFKCQFHEQGCLFVDVYQKKCSIHERLYCKYQTKCKCGADFAGGSFADHMESSSSCRKTSKANIDAVFRLTRNIDDNKKIILFADKVLGTVIGEYKLSDNLLLFRVFTSLPSHELQDLKCTIQLTDSLTKHSLDVEPRRFSEINWRDWYLKEDMNNFASWRKHGTNIKINIVKK